MHGIYLLIVVSVIACLVLTDYRFKLAYFYDRRRTLLTIIPATTLFVLWDSVGINRGVFFVGTSKLLTGYRLGPNFPIEELFFLIMLSYTTLLIHRGIVRYADLHAD